MRRKLLQLAAGCNAL